MRTITYNDVAEPCSRNHVLGTRLLSSDKDSDNNFSRTLKNKD
jgi:hypothetical protein